MPKMARRMTRNNQYHVSQWQKAPTLGPGECDRLRALLNDSLETAEQVEINLPKACQK